MNAPIPLYMMNIMKWFHYNIMKLIKDDEFVNSMNDLKLCDCIPFVDEVGNFFSNHRTENY